MPEINGHIGEKGSYHDGLIEECLICADKNPSDDNWKHRSKGMVCGTCVFFVEKKSNIERNVEARKFGRCRKHAPTLNGWPAVFDTDWCGDHRLDENKI